MNALAPVVPRLAKLLLGSDKDGEVVATARALGRTLASAGANWHDLAGALDPKPETKTVIVYRDRPSAEPTSWSEVARWCRYHGTGTGACSPPSPLQPCAVRTLPALSLLLFEQAFHLFEQDVCRAQADGQVFHAPRGLLET